MLESMVILGAAVSAESLEMPGMPILPLAALQIAPINVNEAGTGVGGIIGYATNNNITACSVTGSTITTSTGYAGGIGGFCYNGTQIIACYTTADVKSGSTTGAFIGCSNGGTVINTGYWQTDTPNQAIGYIAAGDGSRVTKVEGGVTWKTATDAMNAKIPTDGSCPYKYVQRDGDNNPPVLEYTGE